MQWVLLGWHYSVGKAAFCLEASGESWLPFLFLLLQVTAVLGWGRLLFTKLVVAGRSFSQRIALTLTLLPLSLAV